MSIVIDSYELGGDPDDPGNPSTYGVAGTVGGIPFYEGIQPRSLAETAGVWDQAKALAILNAQYNEILRIARADISTRLIQLKDGEATIQFPLKTKTSGGQVASDFLVQGSPPKPATPIEALDLLEQEMAKDPATEPVSVGTLAFAVQKILSWVDDKLGIRFPPNWGAQYQQALDDLDTIIATDFTSGGQAQILNKINLALHRMAEIEKKELLAHRKMLE